MSDDLEIWKAVNELEFADSYMVSSKGRVAKILKGTPNNGYTQVILCKKGVAYKAFRVHQLVAGAFIGEKPEGLVVNHKDENKSNDTPQNLEYVTQKENVHHSLRSGRRRMDKKPGNGQFKALLTLDQVGEIKAMVHEGCPPALLAKEYGVSIQAILHIKTGRNWNRVPAKA